MSTWNTIQTSLGTNLVQLPATDVHVPEGEKISTDSRTIRRGDWFLALDGPNFSGQSFVLDALKKGAEGCIVAEKDFAELSHAENLNLLLVKDPLRALHDLAKLERSKHKNLKTVCITGSVGKTTSRDMISAILTKCDQTLTTKNNENNEIGLAKTVLSLNEKHRFCVLELGARRPGDIKLLNEIAQPNVAVCLNAGSAHLEIFGSYSNLLTTKLEIFSSAPSDCVRVVLRDQEDLYERSQRRFEETLSFGFHPKADICILSKKLERHCQRISLRLPNDKKIEVSSTQTHSAFALNAAAATAACLALGGISEQKILEGLESFEAPAGRYRITRSASGKTLIDDSYNASPESMRSGLDSLDKVYRNAKKALILGDILESGDCWQKDHEGIGLLISRAKSIEKLAVVGKKARLIGLTAEAHGLGVEKINYYDDVSSLVKDLPSLSEAADVFYVKASNKIGLSKCIPPLKNL